MTDKTPSKGETPGSDEAGDSPTAEMPRVPSSGKDPDTQTQPTPHAVNTISDVLSGDRSDSKESEGGGSRDPAPSDKPVDRSTLTAGDKPRTDATPSADSKSTDDARSSPAADKGNDTKGGFAGRMSAAVPSSLRNPKPVVRSTPGSNTGAGSNAGRITGSDSGARPNPGQTDAAKAPATGSRTTGPGAGADRAAGVTPVSRPMTAGEYARTTTPSPSTTAVIPAVRDEPRQSTGAAAAATAASGRQASLKLVRVDPWSVTKVAFALSVALMIVAVVAMTILWIVLSFAGVWDQINSSVTTVLSDDSNSFDITDYLGLGRIVGLTLVIAAINVVITTAVATIGAYLYNLAAQLLGGVDITLAEDD